MKKGKDMLIFSSLMITILMLISTLTYAGPKEDMLALINNERASVGAPPLAIHTSLNTAAQLHCEDMLLEDYFSHISKDGRTFINRINNAGFYGTSYGENIAWASGTADAALIFNAWKNSSGHYANMIDPDFNYVGIGLAEGQWDYSGYYSSIWTLDLGQGICTDGQTSACGATDIGACEYGTRTCSNNTWSDCVGAVYPINEICNNSIDDDCDGATDEFCNCTSHSKKACYNFDVYWFDSCDQLEDKFQECGTDSYIGENYCYNNDVYRDYNDTFCLNAACGSSVIRIKQQECSTYGCANGICNALTRMEMATLALVAEEMTAMTRMQEFFQDKQKSAIILMMIAIQLLTIIVRAILLC